MPFERVNDVHGSHRLPVCVLGVGDRVTNNNTQERTEGVPDFVVDKTRDTLDSPTPSETTDSGFGDTLDRVANNETVSYRFA